MNTDNVVAIQQDTREEIAPTFDDAWLLYPRKVAKKDARRAWDKVPACHVQILIALADWLPVWRDKDEEFLPYLATWINGERYEDVLPAAYRRPAMPQNSHRTADPQPAVRTAIPEHVRALMAKLRARS